MAKFWEKHAKLYKHVTVRFDMRDMPQSVLLDLAKEFGSNGPRWSLRDDPIHDRLNVWFYLFFEDKLRLLSGMKLDRCTFDLQTMFCGQGCCRKGTFYPFVLTAQYHSEYTLDHRDRVSFGIDGRKIRSSYVFNDTSRPPIPAADCKVEGPHVHEMC